MFGGKTQTHKYEYDVDNKNTVYIDALNRVLKIRTMKMQTRLKRKCQTVLF